MALDRDAILKSKDIKRIEVDVPEWGGSVFIGQLNVKQRETMLRDIQELDDSDISALKMHLFINTVQDEKGNLLFTKNDISELEQKSAMAIEKIFTAAESMAATTEGSLGK